MYLIAYLKAFEGANFLGLSTVSAGSTALAGSAVASSTTLAGSTRVDSVSARAGSAEADSTFGAGVARFIASYCDGPVSVCYCYER